MNGGGGSEQERSEGRIGVRVEKITAASFPRHTTVLFCTVLCLDSIAAVYKKKTP